MNITYYILLALAMIICYCAGVLTEKFVCEKEIEMLRTRKIRPARKEKL